MIYAKSHDAIVTSVVSSHFDWAKHIPKGSDLKWSKMYIPSRMGDSISMEFGIHKRKDFAIQRMDIHSHAEEYANKLINFIKDLDAYYMGVDL